jgi:hypothetical protein
MKKLFYLIVLLYSITGFIAHSQVTTSSIQGTVTDEKNEPLTGAMVIAEHLPSGTKYANYSDVDGRFRINNMRVGGPYRVTISLISYSSKAYDNITLSLGNVAEISAQLTPSSTELNEVVVMSGKNDVINKDRTGAAINISNQTLEAIPTISRGLKDFTKISPFANNAGSGTSFAGSNNRYNQFAIDGLVNNDVFGLASSGTNGGQTGIEPVSMDAIEEFQINISPYDVRQNGFTGGGINAVTKSGTNTLHGSAYAYGNNQSLVGRQNAVTETKVKYPEYKDYQAGVTLGGPLVKNKVFFFVSGEITRRKTPLSYEPGTSGSNITAAQMDSVVNTLKRIAPGYDPGSYTDISTETNSNKLLAKIDWNISNNHKLTLRHSYTYGENIDNTRSPGAARFYNNGVYFPSTTNSSGIELKSTLGTKMSNRLMLGYTKVRDDRDPLGDPFPQITIYSGANMITLGSEYSSVANQLDQDIYSFDDEFNLYLNKHTITLGTHNELYKFYNLFVQNIYGRYGFNSVKNFAALGTAAEVSPSYYEVGYSFDESDDPSQINGAAEFKAMQLGFYAQDEYDAFKNLKITAGLRIDIPVFPDQPKENVDFNNVYTDSLGVAVGDVPDTKVMLSPRLGFNWDVFSNKSLQVRGGAGLFTGRVPFVWVSNQFSNTGMLNGSWKEGTLTSSARPIGTSIADIHFVADPFNQPKSAPNRPLNRGDINVIDKNFKFPQVFRSNLAIDKTLPWGIIATIEGIYSKTYNNINFVNLNRKVDGSFTFNATDKRPRYTGTINKTYNEIIKLENTNKGYAYNVMGQLQKQFANGFFAMVAYTYGESKDLNSGTSSVALSNWQFVNNVYGLNDLRLTRSNFSLGSRVTGLLSYKKSYLNDHMSTQISVFYNGQSGQPLSYIYSGNLNNDPTSNDLIFIPATLADINLVDIKDKDGNITSSVADQWAALNAYIENDDYLKDHRGEYAERNGARLPFQHQFDLKIVQEFKLKTGNVSNRLQFSFDIVNVGNLLNKDWGRQYNATNQQVSLINYTGLVNTNKPQFTYTGGGLVKGNPYSTVDLGSRWRAQLGVRYIF